MIGRDEGYAARMMHHERMVRKTREPLPFHHVVGVALGAVVIGSLAALGAAEVLSP
jgi:hypothetical protein